MVSPLGIIEETYPCIFDSIGCIEESFGYGYFILKLDNQYDVIHIDHTSDILPFEGKYVRVWIEEIDDQTLIYMESNGEVSTIEVE